MRKEINLFKVESPGVTFLSSEPKKPSFGNIKISKDPLLAELSRLREENKTAFKDLNNKLNNLVLSDSKIPSESKVRSTRPSHEQQTNVKRTETLSQFPAPLAREDAEDSAGAGLQKAHTLNAKPACKKPTSLHTSSVPVKEPARKTIYIYISRFREKLPT